MKKIKNHRVAHEYFLQNCSRSWMFFLEQLRAPISGGQSLMNLGPNRSWTSRCNFWFYLEGPLNTLKIEEIPLEFLKLPFQLLEFPLSFLEFSCSLCKTFNPLATKNFAKLMKTICFFDTLALKTNENIAKPIYSIPLACKTIEKLDFPTFWP